MKKRIMAFMLCCAFILSGCTIAGREVYVSLVGPFSLFSMGHISCSTQEARLYLANYKNIYGRVGDTYIWSDGFFSDEMEKGFKQAALNHLTKVFSLNVYAREHHISLDDTETSRVKKAAQKYYDSLNQKERSYTKASRGDVEKCYMHYALAKKVNDRLLSSVDNEISEDEARIMDAYVLYLKDEKTYKRMEKEIKGGTSFEQLVASYSKGEKGEVSFGRGTYPDDVERIAFSLENGQISKGVESSDGYYFIKCINKYNEKLSERNKQTIIRERKQKILLDIIDEQKNDRYSRLNLRLWEDMHIESDDEIVTDTLFAVIDDAM